MCYIPNIVSFLSNQNNTIVFFEIIKYTINKFHRAY